MMTGIIGGAIIGFIILGLIYAITDLHTTKNKIIGFGFLIISIVSSATIGWNYNNTGCEKDYYGYIAIKETYESAIINQDLDSLEKLQIVQIAINQNMLLAKKKVDVTKWYNFDLTKENVDKILSLEPIK